MITVFSLISARGAFISKLEGVVLSERRRLKEGGSCSKSRINVHMEFQNFVIISLQITVNNYHFFLMLRIHIINVNKLILGQLNTNSVRNRFDMLSELVKGSFEVFIISETKLDDSFPGSSRRYRWITRFCYTSVRT